MVKTRMAPSPTGEFHIGGLRTLLYNYAFAKKNKGNFVLRIEDTDRVRFVEGSEERTKGVIRDYGFEWDEFYVQSERLEIYAKYAEELVKSGAAYRCYCSKERLEELRKSQEEQGLPRIMYDGHCRDLEEKKDGEYVIRLKVPKNDVVRFKDEVLGDVEFSTEEIDDQVLMKADGFPTYHLAVVVDDHLMGITHIMRGIEWLPSTPKHILLYKALGWELPKYIHLPNLKEKGANRKLSKRDGAVFAVDFLKEGYLPEAVLNFLMFLGWNPGTEKEIYSVDEFIEDFSIEKIHHTDLVAFDREKLAWMNGYYIRNIPSDLLLTKLYGWAEKFDVSLLCKGKEDVFNQRVLDLVKERMKTLSEFNDATEYFYRATTVEREMLIKYADKNKAMEILEGLVTLYEGIEDWNSEKIDRLSHDFVSREGFSPKEAFMTLRVAVTGNTATPPIFDVCALLGKDDVLSRMGISISTLKSI